MEWDPKPFETDQVKNAGHRKFCLSLKPLKNRHYENDMTDIPHFVQRLKNFEVDLA